MVLTALSRPVDTSNLTKVRYLVISDVHLGNQRNPAWRIIKNLRTYFGDFSESSQFIKLDILFIAGDFFDKALWFSNEDVSNILSFILDLFGFCERYGIRLRYLEGTPSHDRKQFKNFLPTVKLFPLLNFKYIEEMCVEGFYDLNMTCLYVPDEHAGGGDKSQVLIAAKLEELGLKEVSISMVHSWFKYQVPEVSSSTKYDEAFFLGITKYYVSNGHIHGPSTYDRIIGQGSFDRVAHREEHAKGGILIELSPDDSYFFFIENKEALPFKTLHIKTKDLDKALEIIDKTTLELPEGSWLRIKAKETHPVLASIDQLGRQYTHVRFEKITEEEEVQKTKQLIDQQAFDTVDYKAVHIDKSNIVNLILDAMHRNEMDHDFNLLENHLKGLL